MQLLIVNGSPPPPPYIPADQLQPNKLIKQTLEKLGWSAEKCDTQVIHAINCCRVLKYKTSKTELQSCHQSLIDQVRALTDSNSVILLLGNNAMHAFTGDFKLKITNERGRLLQNPYGLRILPTLHPDAILQHPVDFKKFRADLSYAVGLAMGTCNERKPDDVFFEVVSPATLPTVVDKMVLYAKQKPLELGADIETTGLDPRVDTILCLGVAYAPTRSFIFPVELMQQYPEQFEKLFNAPIRWIWHNGKFDTSFLNRAGFKAKVNEDCMLLHYALDETRGTHGLKQLAQEYLGAEDYEQELKKYLPNKKTSWAVIPREVLYPYLARDCCYTLQLFLIFRRQIQHHPGPQKAYQNIYIPASNFLLRVESRGIAVNVAALDSLQSDLEKEKAEALAEIQRLVSPYWNPQWYCKDTGAKTPPAEFKPSSPKQLKWLLFNRLRFQTPKGYKPGTNKELLGKLIEYSTWEEGTQLIKALLRLRKAHKLLSTYVIGIRNVMDKDQRVHPSYLIHGTVTGRLSSQKPNAQNVPRQANIRDLFCAPPGKVLIEADYSQAELRVLAHLANDAFLKEVYRTGRDLHDEVSLQLFGPEFTSEQRMRAKALNFGIAYGRTAMSLVIEFGMSFNEAQALIDAWLARMPGAKEYLEKCRSDALLGIPLETPFGRQRRFGLISDRNIKEVQNEAVNFRIQSTASDLTLLSAMIIEPQLPAECYIINLVHDSILFEVPDTPEAILAVTRLALNTMKSTAERLLATDFPFEADAKFGYSWGTKQKLPLREELNAMTIEDAIAKWGHPEIAVVDQEEKENDRIIDAIAMPE